MIDVKKFGAFGDGKLPDLSQLRAAIKAAAEHTGGVTVYFPPGEYFLGAADETWLLAADALQDVRFVGERATLSCKGVNGSSSILVLRGCRNVTVEGLTFRDYGFDRKRVMGAAAIRLTNMGTIACENTEIRDCTFESLVTAVVCRASDEGERGRVRGITLSNLSVNRATYGFNFQDAGDNVTGRGLRCNDVQRSYFPYGVSRHDVDLDTTNNATGFTDVLIGCYQRDTSDLRIKLKSRGKRGGDAIINLDHQNQQPGPNNYAHRNIRIEADIDDVDCRLETAISFRALDRSRRAEPLTSRRWDGISIDGNIRICDKTKLFDFESVSKTPGALHIGPKLAQHPRLPKTFPGFNVTIARS